MKQRGNTNRRKKVVSAAAASQQMMTERGASGEAGTPRGQQVQHSQPRNRTGGPSQSIKAGEKSKTTLGQKRARPLSNQNAMEEETKQEVTRGSAEPKAAMIRGEGGEESSSSDDDCNPLMRMMAKKAPKPIKRQKLPEDEATKENEKLQRCVQNVMMLNHGRMQNFSRLCKPVNRAYRQHLTAEDHLQRASSRHLWQSLISVVQVSALENTKEVYVVQNPDFQRLVFIQPDSILQLDLSKRVDQFVQLSEVRGRSRSPQTDFCLPAHVSLTRREDWEWIDMINTFYHNGSKQVFELKVWYNPIDQTLAAKTMDQPVSSEVMSGVTGAAATSTDVEMNEAETAVNVISQTYESKQTEQVCYTLSFMTEMGAEGNRSIQVFKQTKQGRISCEEQSLVMEVSMISDSRISMNDILVFRNTILNLEKRTQSKHKNAFPLFNQQFVAIADNQNNVVEVFRVVQANSSDENSMYSMLEVGPLVRFKGAFEKQIRQVSPGRPLLNCNGTLHMMQLLVTYANYFVEVVEIFPGSNASGPSALEATIERQFIHSYAEPLRYYPSDDRQAKVQVICLNELNSGFFAIYTTQESGIFRIYDLQEKCHVHELCLTQGQKQRLVQLSQQRTYSVLYKVSSVAVDSARTYTVPWSANNSSNQERGQFDFCLHQEKPHILAAF